jgi:WD40 repeat protein
MSAPPAASASVIISLATYDGQLLGWSLTPQAAGHAPAQPSSSSSGALAAGAAAAAAAAPGAPGATLEYAFKAGEAPIRALASRGSTMAVACDEVIHVFDLKRRKQEGTLSHHRDTVTAMAFAGGASSLLSADAGGTLCFWDTRSWTPVLSVHGHK